MATIPPRPATGPELATVLGGTFDLDNGKIRFEDQGLFVRCGFTGRVRLGLNGEEHLLGMMSDGVGALAAEFVIAVERLRAGISPS